MMGGETDLPCFKGLELIPQPPPSSAFFLVEALEFGVAVYDEGE